MAVSGEYREHAIAKLDARIKKNLQGIVAFQKARKNVTSGKSWDEKELLTKEQTDAMAEFWPDDSGQKNVDVMKLSGYMADPVFKASYLELEKLAKKARAYVNAVEAKEKIDNDFADFTRDLGGDKAIKDLIKEDTPDSEIADLFSASNSAPDYVDDEVLIKELRNLASGETPAESAPKEKAEQKPAAPTTTETTSPPAAPATEKKEKPTPTPSAVATSAVEKTEKAEPKVPTAAAVLSVESEAESPEAASTSTRVKNAPVAPSPGVLLGEPPAGKPAEPQVSQTTTINNFNTQAGAAPASDDQTKAKSILEEQLRKLEEMKSFYREEEKIVKSTETARSIAASPSTALAEINKRFDRTETGKEGGAEEAPKSRFAGIKASILKGASSLGSLMSGLLSPTPKGEEAQAGGTSAVTKVQDYIKSALGKGFSPGEVTGFEPASEKSEPAARVKQAALDVKGAGPAQPKEPLSPMGVAGKMAAESGSEQEEFSPAEIGTQEILNKAGEESPDVLKMGNFESTLKIEPNMLQSPAAGAGSTNLSTSVSNEQSNVKVKSSNPISNRSLVNNVLNPPNPVVAEVKGLNKTISSTSEKMNSSIEKISTSNVKEAAIPLTPGSQNLTTNNSTFNQMGGMQQEEEKKEQEQGEQGSADDSLSSYYLQAIYDALVVQGIKIRTI